MTFPFAPGPKRDGIFAEFIFGSLGLGVIAATLLTLNSTPSATSQAQAPLGVVAASVWSDELRLVDVSALAQSMVQEQEEAQAEEAEEAEAQAEDALPGEADEQPAREPRPRAKPSPEAEEPAGLAEAPEEAEAAAPKAEAKARGGKPKGRRCTEPADPAIVSTAPGRFTVQQSVVRRYTRDWSKLDELGWSRAHKNSEGRSDGLELGGIRCGSDIYDAGFRSGDVIHTVNGRKIHSIPQAIIAYTSLHNDDNFAVEITRRGKRQTLVYRLK